MPLETGLERMYEMFQWLTRTGGYTNDSCGFHVGVSMIDRAAQNRLDILKLIVLFDEDRITQLFGRQASRWCQKHQPQILNRAQVYGQQGDAGFRAASTEEKLKRCIDRSKFFTANLAKLPGYVEFRAMGGQYHTRFEDCRNTIRYYAQIIEAACTPGMMDDVYLPKLEALKERVAPHFRRFEEEQRRAAEQARRAEEARLRALQVAIERDQARIGLRVATDADRARAERRRLRDRLAREAATEAAREEQLARDASRLAARGVRAAAELDEFEARQRRRTLEETKIRRRRMEAA